MGVMCLGGSLRFCDVSHSTESFACELGGWGAEFLKMHFCTLRRLSVLIMKHLAEAYVLLLARGQGLLCLCPLHSLLPDTQGCSWVPLPDLFF